MLSARTRWWPSSSGRSSASTRFEATILAILRREGHDRRIIDRPNLADAIENAQRRAVLGDYRGYGRNEDVFTDFPANVRWYRALATPAELAQVRYINDDYWIELSGGSWLVTDAVARIRQGIEAFGVGNGAYWYLADALRAGATFPELILVGVGLAVLVIWARGIGFYRRALALVVFISLGTTGALWLVGYLAGVDVRGPAVLMWDGGSLIALVLFCYGFAQRFTRARRH